MFQAEAEEAEREPPSEYARGAGWNISAGMAGAECLEFNVVELSPCPLPSPLPAPSKEHAVSLVSSPLDSRQSRSVGSLEGQVAPIEIS